MALQAKRGDVFAIVREERTAYIGKPSETRTRVDVVRITSCTRDGIAKAAEDCQGYTVGAWALTSGRALLIAADRVRPEDAMRVAREHHYDGHPNQPKPFDSVEELREALRPYLLERAS